MLVSSYQQSIAALGRLASHTDTLDRLMRIADQGAQLHIQTRRLRDAAASIGFGKLHSQLRDGIELLGVAQSLSLAHELTCPNSQKLYFFQQMSWQKSMGRIFLAGYSCFRNVRWLQKLGFVQLTQLGRVLIGNLTLVRLMTDCSYIFYRLFTLAEGVRTQTWWRVAVSAGKVCVTAALLLMSATKISSPVYMLGVTGLSLVLDCYIIKQRMVCNE